MAQHDYDLANASGAAFRTDLNNVLAAIVSQNSGATEPVTKFAFQWWYDTTASALKIRNAANNAWITLVTFDQTNGLFKIDFDKGANIASATTADIGAATGNFVHITGTTTITGLGTIKAGAHRWVIFDGALTLTHNATSLILPSGANITTAAGDAMLAISEGAGNWRVPLYQKKDGTPLVGGGDGRLIGFQVFTAGGTWTPTAGTNSVVVECKGSGGGGGGSDQNGVSVGGAGGGGGEGETAIERITAGLGATETITIGAAGAAGAAAGGNGGTGGTTSFGSHMTAIGGGGGSGTGSASSIQLVLRGGIGGTGGTGADISHTGQAGMGGSGISNAGHMIGGTGGGRGGGRGGQITANNQNSAGAAGNSGGGGGGAAGSNTIGTAGGAGGTGYVKVWEYS